MAKHTTQDALTDFFQFDQDLSPTGKSTQLVLAHERDVIPANEVESFFVDVDARLLAERNRRKDYWYWFTAAYYKTAEGYTESQWRERWKEKLPHNYALHFGNAKAIRAWQLSVPDYPRAMTVYLLTRSYCLTTQDKLTFVKMFNEGAGQDELVEWARPRTVNKNKVVNVRVIVSEFIKDYDKATLASILAEYRSSNPKTSIYVYT